MFFVLISVIINIINHIRLYNRYKHQMPLPLLLLLSLVTIVTNIIHNRYHPCSYSYHYHCRFMSLFIYYYYYFNCFILSLLS